MTSLYVLHRLEKICRSVFQYNKSFCQGKINKTNSQYWQSGDISNMHVCFLFFYCMLFLCFSLFYKTMSFVHMPGFVECVS